MNSQIYNSSIVDKLAELEQREQADENAQGMKNLNMTMESLLLSQKDVNDVISQFIKDYEDETKFWSKMKMGQHVQIKDNGRQVIVNKHGKSGTILSERNLQQMINEGPTEFIMVNDFVLNLKFKLISF